MVKVIRISKVNLLKSRKSNISNAHTLVYSNRQSKTRTKLNPINNNNISSIIGRKQPRPSEASSQSKCSLLFELMFNCLTLTCSSTIKPALYQSNVSINSLDIPRVSWVTNIKGIDVLTVHSQESHEKEKQRRDRKRGAFVCWKVCCCCLWCVLLLGIGLSVLIVAITSNKSVETRGSITTTKSTITASTSMIISSTSAITTSTLSTSESTTTMATSINSRLNVNLLINGDGETGPCETRRNITHPSYWNYNGSITQIYYNNSLFGSVTPTSPGPNDRGNCYFFGHSSMSTSMWQTVNLTDAIDSLLIDNQTVKFNLSAWLGGWMSQNDNARVTLIFYDQSNQVVGSSTTIGPVLASDRSSITSLLPRQANGYVPIGARSFTVIVTLTCISPTDNDGIVDNIAVALFI